MICDVGGEDFYNTIRELGEKVTFVGSGLEQYASLAPNMLNKAIGTTDGAYWFTGVMTFDNMNQQEELAGAYFKRETQPNSTLMIYSIFPENSSQKLAITHCVECNEKVDIISHNEPTGELNNYGKPIMGPVYAYRDVYAYVKSYTKDAKDSVAGSMEETITYLALPAKYTLSPKNIIMKDAFVFDEKTKKNVLKKIPYRIESIDTSMMDSYDGKPNGILTCMIKEAASK